MLIQPDSIIRLIRGCHIDNSYKDTIYFASREEQKEYFYNTLRGITFTKQSYQRYADGVLHIQAKADDIYDCNYLMFQNTAFGNKWFYAFVNRIEYVNNVSSKVYYEIDVIQTWLWGLEIHPCFIERTHTRTDQIGDNRIAENFDIGEYNHTAQGSFGAWDEEDLCVVIEYQEGLVDIASNVFDGFVLDNGLLYVGDELRGGFLYHDIYDKAYSYTNYVWFKVFETDEWKNFMKSFLDTINVKTFGGIRGIFMMPWEVMYDINTKQANHPYDSQFQTSTLVEFSDNFELYEPNNKKLFTYPYCAVNIRSDTNTGVYLDPLEISGDGEFILDSTVIINCPLQENSKIIAYPESYNGAKGLPYAIESSSFPSCKYVTDKMVEWLATQSIQTIVNVASASFGYWLNSKTGSNVTKLNGANERDVFNAEYNRLKSKEYLVKDVAKSVYGATVAVAGANASSNGGGAGIYGTKDGGQVFFYAAKVKRYIAEIIDDYFTMFGYAIKSIQMPSFYNRTKFTYIETKGFSVHASNETGAPSSALKAIEEIHDNGITYWTKDSVIGDYSQTNTPIEEVE